MGNICARHGSYSQVTHNLVGDVKQTGVDMAHSVSQLGS